MTAGKALAAYSSVNNVYDLIKMYAQARKMALATVANADGPYHAQIHHSDFVATRALELANSYFALEVRAFLPTNAEVSALPRDDIFNAQYVAVKMEGELRQALAEAEGAVAHLQKQKAQLKQEMDERIQGLVFTPVSTPYADAYFFAMAAGRINVNIDAALVSYRRAINAIRMERGHAQAAAKSYEIIMRREGRSGYFGDIKDKDLEKARLPKFSVY